MLDSTASAITAQSAMTRSRSRWRVLLPGLLLLLAGAPGIGHAAGSCDKWLDQTVQAVGSYVPTDEPYSRSFAFVMRVDCGSPEWVAVERPTGNLPVCKTGQEIAVTGKLRWDGWSGKGHYEISNPTSAACR